MLWYAAPLLSQTRGLTIPSRLRYTLVLLTAMPLLLAALHLLAIWPLLIVAAAACALRFRFARGSRLEYNPWDGLAIAIVFLTASAYIPRAPTDGDSLAYHLPNAIAWVQAGSLDPTWMRYWWYPGGSEISIAGLIASGGLWITGVSSLLAAMMLTSRINMWLRSLDVPAATATAMSAAFITITTAAFQTYDQRNDLVLAAWFIESLWMLRNASWSGALPVAILALIKPYGWVYALLAVVCTRQPRALVGFVPLALWIAHDALLAPRALVSIASTNALGTWSTTIAGNLPASLTVLAKSIAERGPTALCCFVAPVFALFARGKERSIAIAGTCALGLFLLTPFGYANDMPQLALGWSLRYDLASLALGMLCLAPLGRRFPTSIAVLATCSALAGIARLLYILNHDTTILIAFLCSVVVSLAAIAAFFTPFRRVAAIAAAAPALALMLYGSNVAAAHVAGFYAVSTNGTGFFRWFESHAHDAESVNLRAGELLMLAPSARVYDADAVSCSRAAAESAIIILAKGARSAPVAKGCGEVLFEDADFVAVLPR